MKRFIIISLLLFGISGFNKGQTVTQDWTKADCKGQIWQLHPMLDSGKVVIMNFMMVGCGPCITATAWLEQIQTDFNATHPGRVILLSMCDNNATSCTDLEAWGTAYEFPSPKIPNCQSDVNYYGGAGMPTIIVAGNAGHQIFYKKKSFSSSDDPVIRQAVLDALAPVNRDEDLPPYDVAVFPVPANDQVTIEINKPDAGKVEIELFNLLGEKIADLHRDFLPAGPAEISFRAGTLPAGTYFIVIRESQYIIRKKIILQ